MMRVKAIVCTGIVFILTILLGSWAFFRVEALAYDMGARDALTAEGGTVALPNFIYNPECIYASPLLGEKHFSSGLAAPSDASGAAQSSAAVIRGRVLEV